MTERCPRCDSPDPRLHPAVQFEGEVSICPDKFHQFEPPKPAPLLLPMITTLKTGRFPHEAYRPSCSCLQGQPKEVRNYAGHVIAPPVCSTCSRSYHLDIELMSKLSA